MIHFLGSEARILARLLIHPLLWLLLALTVGGAVLAYQVPHGYAIDVGSPADQAYVHNFHDRRDDASGRTFRWSDAYGYVILPGTGGGVPFTVTLTLNPGQPDAPLTLIINGETFVQRPFAAGWQTVTIPVDRSHPQALAARDLVLELRAPGFVSPDAPGETRGLMLDQVTISPPGPGFITPAVAQLGYLAAVVLLVYLLLGRAVYPLDPAARAGARGGVWRDFALTLPSPSGRGFRGIAPALMWIPVLGAGIVAAILIGLLAAVHLPLTVATGQLVAAGGGTYTSTYLLLILAEALARRITPETRRGARAVAVLLAAAFLVRFGLMALPQTVIIDLPWHMKWLHELLAGHWESLYFPGALSSVPAEWGLSVLIPKSPLFYFVAAPLAVLPWDLDVSVKALVCLLEVSTILFCYGLLARFAPTLGGWRAGWWAGFAYAANPLGYRALAYGILPTILAQWLTVAFFTLLLVWAARRFAGVRRSLTGPAGPFLLLMLLFAASLVAFPTIAVFNTWVVGLLALVWLRGRYRWLGAPVLALIAGAWVTALIAYYGIYVSEFVNTTLPEILAGPPVAAQGSAPPPSSTVHWTGPLDLLGWTGQYLVSLIPLLGGLAGLALLWTSRAAGAADRVRPERLPAWLTAAWITVLFIFFAVNYRVDMIGKHLFYTMVPLSLGLGIFLWLLVRRGGAARLFAALTAGALAWTALAFWVARLVSAST
jgi:hypothetical protein